MINAQAVAHHMHAYIHTSIHTCMHAQYISLTNNRVIRLIHELYRTWLEIIDTRHCIISTDKHRQDESDVRAEAVPHVVTPPDTPQPARVSGVCVSGEGRIRATWGWISVDRGSKATLPLTIPRRVFKSSAKDSTRRSIGIVLQGGLRDASIAQADAKDTCLWGPNGPYCWSANGRRAHASLLARILT